MNNDLILERLEGVKTRFEEVGRLISDPEIISDMKRYIRLNKEYKDLEPVIRAYTDYRNLLSNISSAREMLATEKDEELRDMAKSELEDLSGKVDPLEEEIKLLLIPSDPQDEKSAMLEIRAGTGGDEAGIFAGDLYRMYSKFSESMGWKMEATSFTEGPAGGYKEIILHVRGEGFVPLLSTIKSSNPNSSLKLSGIIFSKLKDFH